MKSSLSCNYSNNHYTICRGHLFVVGNNNNAHASKKVEYYPSSCSKLINSVHYWMLYIIKVVIHTSTSVVVTCQRWWWRDSRLSFKHKSQKSNTFEDPFIAIIHDIPIRVVSIRICTVPNIIGFIISVIYFFWVHVPPQAKKLWHMDSKLPTILSWLLFKLIASSSRTLRKVWWR